MSGLNLALNLFNVGRSAPVLGERFSSGVLKILVGLFFYKWCTDQIHASSCEIKM